MEADANTSNGFEPAPNQPLSVSGSLELITEDAPQWMGHLDELTSQIASCKIELSELSELAAHRIRARNGSTESLRPGMGNEAVSDPNDLEMEPAQMLASAAKQQHAQMLRRKRKSTSLTSDAAPAKFRTRSMIIVRYDSQVQDGFVNVVKSVSTARNNLRKARMAESMEERMRQTTALGRVEIPLGGEGLANRLAFTRTTRSRGGGSSQGGGTDGGEQPPQYDAIDKSLESAMSMCEHAAHQSLRDGDCAIEIQTIKERMQDAIKMAEEGTHKAKAKEALAAAQTAQEEQEEEEREEAGSTSLGAVEPLSGDTPIEVDDT